MILARAGSVTVVTGWDRKVMCESSGFIPKIEADESVPTTSLVCARVWNHAGLRIGVPYCTEGPFPHRTGGCWIPGDDARHRPDHAAERVVGPRSNPAFLGVHGIRIYSLGLES